MKNTDKQNTTVNVLILILFALLFLSGSLMWTQHNMYHQSFWNGTGVSQTSSANHMNWFNASETNK